jgi:hypothetical protein
MEVDGPEAATFLLDKLGDDCGRMQQYRELTQNAIEAILMRPDKTGEIVWDVDWDIVERTGIYKLCVTDNGIGMSEDDLHKYINHLSSSGKLQALFANYGIGAKIAAGTANPSGLRYLSWKNGAGNTVCFWRDPDSKLWGFRRFRTDDGSDLDVRMESCLPLPDEQKPDGIIESGTRVILYGTETSSNTMKPPPTSLAKGVRWIGRYLSTRYFSFPETVSIKVREFSRIDPAEWPKAPSGAGNGAYLRKVHGTGYYLEKHSEKSGVVELSDAKAHWWLLPEKPKQGKDRKNRERLQTEYWYGRGHTAALFQNEIYEPRTKDAGTMRLQSFGIVSIPDRVVVYLVPEGAKSDTQRGKLLIDGNELPWSRWGVEFSRKMPEEIASAIREKQDRDNESTDYREQIQKRIESMRDLRKKMKLRKKKDGPDGAESSDAGDTSGEDKGNSRGGKNKDRNPDPFSLKTSPDRSNAENRETYQKAPEVIWQSEEECGLRDRSAQYLYDLHRLVINKDFRAFRGYVDHFTEKYKGVLGIGDIVHTVVREWYEAMLVESVLSIRCLEGTENWGREEIKRALSREALSAGVMANWFLKEQIRVHVERKIGGRGRLKVAG